MIRDVKLPNADLPMIIPEHPAREVFARLCSGGSRRFPLRTHNPQTKAVVYTAVIRTDLSNLAPAPNVDGIEFFAITDSLKAAPSGWEKVTVNVGADMSSVIANRFLKYPVLPLFNVEKQIYVDDNIEISNRLNEFISLLSDVDFAAHLHPLRHTLSDEIELVASTGRIGFLQGVRFGEETPVEALTARVTENCVLYRSYANSLMYEYNMAMIESLISGPCRDQLWSPILRLRHGDALRFLDLDLPWRGNDYFCYNEKVMRGNMYLFRRQLFAARKYLYKFAYNFLKKSRFK